MITASQVRAGMAIRFDGQVYKVIGADYHPGQGKMGGVLHARLRNLGTGTQWEHSFRSDLKVEDIALDRGNFDFLYRDDEHCYFMDPETFEQVGIPLPAIGDQARLLEANMRVGIEFVEGRPVSVQFPDVVEVKIEDTAPPVHQQDSTWKPARLTNGLEVMVPQFIKPGDMIRLDAGQLKYMDRARASGRSG